VFLPIVAPAIVLALFEELRTTLCSSPAGDVWVLSVCGIFPASPVGALLALSITEEVMTADSPGMSTGTKDEDSIGISVIKVVVVGVGAEDVLLMLELDPFGGGNCVLDTDVSRTGGGIAFIVVTSVVAGAVDPVDLVVIAAAAVVDDGGSAVFEVFVGGSDAEANVVEVGEGESSSSSLSVSYAESSSSDGPLSDSSSPDESSSGTAPAVGPFTAPSLLTILGFSSSRI
jgi:hypothetical protein